MADKSIVQQNSDGDYILVKAKDLGDGTFALAHYETNTTTATDVSTLATSTNQTNGNQKTQVTNFPATQSISGTITVSNPTTSVTTVLPTHTPYRGIGQTAAALIPNNHKVLHSYRITAATTAGVFVHFLDQASATSPNIANVKWTEVLTAGAYIVIENMDMLFTSGIVVVPSTSVTAITTPIAANAPSIQCLTRLS